MFRHSLSLLTRTATNAIEHVHQPTTLHTWYQSLVALQHVVTRNTMMPACFVHTSPPEQQQQPPPAESSTNVADAMADVVPIPKNHVQNPPYVPWTPTRDLVKRKTYGKRMAFLTSLLEKEYEEQLKEKYPLPDFKAGDVLEIRLAVPENKRKEATIRGICMGRTKRGPRSTFRIRNHINLVGTFERTFPVYSPHIKWIKILESRKVTRTKLYYLRDKPFKEYRV